MSLIIDSFVGPGLDPMWTRRGVTAAQETWNGSDLYLSSFPQGQAYLTDMPAENDVTVILDMNMPMNGYHMVGPAILDVNGNGAAAIQYGDGRFYVVGVKNYRYDEVNAQSFQSGWSNSLQIRLKKIGSLYFAAKSTDGGATWGETAGITGSANPSKVAIGSWLGTNAITPRFYSVSIEGVEAPAYAPVVEDFSEPSSLPPGWTWRPNTTNQVYLQPGLQMSVGTAGGAFRPHAPEGDQYEVIATIENVNQDQYLMLGPALVDANGHGMIACLYSRYLYVMRVQGYQYPNVSGAGVQDASIQRNPVGYYKMKLRRVGTAYFSSISTDGGTTWSNEVGMTSPYGPPTQLGFLNNWTFTNTVRVKDISSTAPGEGTLIVPTPAGPGIGWYDGSAEQLASLEGWWDGAALQPASALGWWDGAAIQGLGG